MKLDNAKQRAPATGAGALTNAYLCQIAAGKEAISGELGPAQLPARVHQAHRAPARAVPRVAVGGRSGELGGRDGTDERSTGMRIDDGLLGPGLQVRDRAATCATATRLAQEQAEFFARMYRPRIMETGSNAKGGRKPG
jgi:hypothetical protein